VEFEAELLAADEEELFVVLEIDLKFFNKFLGKDKS